MGNYYSNPEETKEETTKTVSPKHFEYHQVNVPKKQIVLKPFDLSNIKDFSSIAIIGKRNSGKSTLIKKILSVKNIGNTENLYMPEEWNEEDCKKFLEKQLTKKTELENKIIDNYHGALVIDDICYNPSWIKSKSFEKLILKGKSYNTSILFSIQRPSEIPLYIRDNIDYIFIFSNNIESQRKQLYQHYQEYFDSLEYFNNVMDKYTENFNCIVIDRYNSIYYCNAKW